MQAYQWQCHACTQENHVTHDNCEGCGFPASARGEDILRERTARTGGAVAPAGSADSVDNLLAGLSLWRRGLATAGLLIAGLGALWLKFSWTMAHFGIAWLMLAGGMFLAVISVHSDAASSPAP